MSDDFGYHCPDCDRDVCGHTVLKHRRQAARIEELEASLTKCEFALTLLLGGCPSQSAEEEAVMAARRVLKVEGTK